MFCGIDLGLENSIFYQFYYGLYAMLSLAASGYVMGYSAVELPLLTRQNGTSNIAILNDNEIGATWFASIIAIAIPLGCISSVFTMKAGRRIALMNSGIVFLIGWIIIATSYGIVQLLIGRFITGLGIGLAATPAPVYLSEIAMLKNKTTLTACTNIATCGGVMLIFFVAFLIPENWRTVAAVSVIIPILSTICILFLTPESPQWLLHKGRVLDAKQALLRLRGLKSETSQFLEEFDQMIVYHEPSMRMQYIKNEENNQTFDDVTVVSSSWNCSKKFRDFLSAIKRPEVWKPFSILNAFFFFQQFCGIYVIIAYAVDVVVHSGIIADAYFITVLIGLVQFVGAVVLVICSSKIGRRTSSIISGVGMSLSLGMLGLYTQFEKQANLNEKYSAIPIVAILIFVGTGSFGFQALPWAMIGELYPTKYVNIMGPLTCCISGIFNFASLQIYPLLVKYDFCIALYFYCFICIIATVFIILVLPETHERSKNEIEQCFQST